MKPSLAFLKICVWPLNLSRTMEFDVPKRPSFKATLSIATVQHVLQWERQKMFSRCKCQGAMADKYLRISFFVLCQTFPWFCEKNKGECQTWRKFQPSLCGTNIQKNKPIHIMVYGHFSWSMFGLHRVKGPKALIFSFFYKSNHEVWLWQNDIWHQTNSWSIINNPLLNKKFGIHVSSLLCVGGGGFGVSLHRWSKNVISNKIK